MSEHHATIRWRRSSAGFSYEEYNREHDWQFGSGSRIAASAARKYLGNGENVDPEEAFVASVSSCHMLTFLAICARKRIVVDRYEDAATGHLESNAEGRLAITRVELRPRIMFGGIAPDAQVLVQLHEMAHRECFIANSVNCAIEVLAP
jgi:organic hydroperoxide reductase OsmC/OhrA